MLDRRLVEGVAAALGTEPGLVEKEWHVVRAISVIAGLDHGLARPVFSGGTSLSVGWGLIKRFSEDIDFKVAMPEPANPSQGRARRGKFRENVFVVFSHLELTGNVEPLGFSSGALPVGACLGMRVVMMLNETQSRASTIGIFLPRITSDLTPVFRHWLKRHSERSRRRRLF